MIRVAKTAGFCFGVNRAVETVYKLLDEDKTVCTLGPIIHNPQLVEELGRKGSTHYRCARGRESGGDGLSSARTVCRPRSSKN